MTYGNTTRGSLSPAILNTCFERGYRDSYLQLLGMSLFFQKVEKSQNKYGHPALQFPVPASMI